jgi:hypothetical protein
MEADILRGAAVALRRRADRQTKKAEDGTTIGEKGSPVRTGEAAIAVRVAETLSQLAEEFEAELSSCRTAGATR